MTLRPMLAAKFDKRIIQNHLDEVGFLWQQPKIDGMRALIDDDAIPRTRSGKEHKNRYLRQWALDHPSFRGVDGEVVSGHTYSEETFRASMSGIRAEDGSPDFTFFVFDYFLEPNAPYYERAARMLLNTTGGSRDVEHITSLYHAKIVATPTKKVTSLEEIEALDVMYVAAGWEGSILRRDDRPYKHNRATPRDGTLTKLKSFTDAEAIVTGYEPWYTNGNEATQSPLGFTVRSAHQENLTPIDRLGALHVELLTDRSVKFKIGVMRGVDHSGRDRLWAERDSLVGRICTFSHQGYGGGYDRPRTPVFLNWRSASEF